MQLRDAERLKEKLELTLDGKQLFVACFSGAVLASLLFILGVMVGRRLEERGRARAEVAALVDPLAALDELAVDEEQRLAFPETLSAEPGSKPKPLGAADLAPSLQDPAKEAMKEPVAKLPSTPAVAVKAAPELAGKGKFTLQLSSFQDRGEAEAFSAKMKSAGYRTSMASNDVPGKGTFYRVRVGAYQTHPEALAAKGDFERRQHIIAYVTKL